MKEPKTDAMTATFLDRVMTDRHFRKRGDLSDYASRLSGNGENKWLALSICQITCGTAPFFEIPWEWYAMRFACSTLQPSE